MVIFELHKSLIQKGNPLINGKDINAGQGRSRF